MMKMEMTYSNHTTATAAETVDNRSVDIDMNIIKKERSLDTPESPSITSRSLSEKWTGLNDCHNNKGSSSNIKIKIEEESHEKETLVSVTSEPRKKLSRRDSNESTYSLGSTGSAGSKSSSKSSSKRKTATKRRSWKKPKDKPKRPLSAYNIFFKHTRSRIVEGLSEEGTAEETIEAIESIVANSTETRRHRKTHGQISFGDLARKIADKWKNIDKNQRTIFDHYAALDMKRYRRDVSIWKAKKESEALAASSGNNSFNETGRAAVRPSSLEVSGSSECTSGSFNYLTDSHTTLGPGDNYDEWNTPQHRALTTSFNSVDSEENFGFEPLQIADLQESQNSMIGRSVPSFIESSSNGNNSNNMMASDSNIAMNSSNGWEGDNKNMTDIHNKKLRDIWMKNRQLEESINNLKKELSTTNFSIGNNHNNINSNVNNHNNNNRNGNNHNNNNSNGNDNNDSPPTDSKFLIPPFPVGPSIDRMQQFHRRRLLMGDIMPSAGNDQNQYDKQGLGGNSSHSNFDVVEEALVIGDVMDLDPFDLNPVPFEEVFNSSGAEAKKKELITNLGYLDFFGDGGGSC